MRGSDCDENSARAPSQAPALKSTQSVTPIAPLYFSLNRRYLLVGFVVVIVGAVSLVGFGRLNQWRLDVAFDEMTKRFESHNEGLAMTNLCTNTTKTHGDKLSAFESRILDRSSVACHLEELCPTQEVLKAIEAQQTFGTESNHAQSAATWTAPDLCPDSPVSRSPLDCLMATCLGTATLDEASLSLPVAPSGLAVTMGRHYVGATNNWLGLHASKLCVLPLVHPTYSDLQRGTVKPLMRVKAQPPIMSNAWYVNEMKYFRGLKHMPVRSFSHVTILRNALLWESGWTTSGAATIGGGTDRDWRYVPCTREDGWIKDLRFPYTYDNVLRRDTLMFAARAMRDGVHRTPAIPIALNLVQYNTVGFYHFMIEVLPRLWLVKDVVERLDARILMALELDTFMSESFRLLSMDTSRVQIIPQRGSTPHLVEWMLIPTSGGSFENIMLPEMVTMGVYMLGSALIEGAGSSLNLQKFKAKASAPSKAQCQMMQVERLGLARALTPPNEQPLQPQFADLTCDDEWLDDYFARATPTPNISRSAIKNLKIDHARRTAIAEYDQQVSSSRPVVLLVKRAVGRKRWMANHDDILAWIKETLPHTQVHVVESASVSAQAAMFRAATVVFAPHGAGLSSLIFSRPGTSVVEVIPQIGHKRSYATYKQLSLSLQLNYFGTVANDDEMAMKISKPLAVEILHRAWATSWYALEQAAQWGSE